MPGQRRDALARGRVPDLDRLVVRPGDDAPAVGEDGDAVDLKDRKITHARKQEKTPRHTSSECPASVATDAPVAASHTLAVLSHDPETMRRPSGKTATLST